MTTGDRIRARRGTLGITQVELAERINVAHSTICGWETGKREPNIKTLCKLSDLLGTSIDYLCGHDSITRVGEQTEFASEEIEQIHEYFSENIQQATTDKVKRCEREFSRALDEYLAAVCEDMFQQAFVYGYNCGKNETMYRQSL
ncbi:MAG: helix-turn-helix transcriptional regulator [Lachnospiraceae bacterium]|nr:helix-turn-helix transcriptional regulator [Lachnospiraceae bacterium]